MVNKRTVNEPRFSAVGLYSAGRAAAESDICSGSHLQHAVPCTTAWPLQWSFQYSVVLIIMQYGQRRPITAL